MENLDIETLIRKRGGLKKRVTHFTTFICGLLEKTNNLATELSAVDLGQLNEKICRFEDVIKMFECIQSAIEDVVVVDQLDQQYEERDAFEKRYDVELARARVLLKEATLFNIKTEARAENDVSGRSMNSEHSADNMTRSDRSFRSLQLTDNVVPLRQVNSNNNPAQVPPAPSGLKLPTIQLPTFSGSSDWLEFRDTYTSLIHESQNISSIQKYHYLRAALKGEAAEIIKALDFSAETYELAWKMVCDRYNNTRRLVNNHLKAFFELEPITRESADSLRSMWSSISKHLKSLGKLGLPIDHWDAIIVYLVTRKLDSTSLTKWEEFRHDKDYPTLKQLETFLQSRADLLESIETSKVKLKAGKLHGATRGFLTKAESCVNCREEHTLSKCTKFKDLSADDRLKRVKDWKLCVNCLRGGHFARHCRFQPCGRCKFKHHTLLHLERVKPIERPSTTSAEEVTKIVSSTSRIKGQVLLATAQVVVKDKNGKKHVVRALLDSGSQSSFISQELCDRLGVELERVNISVTGLNNSVSVTRAKCDLELGSINTSYVVMISCYVLKEITGEVPSVRICRNELKIPENLELADPSFDVAGCIDMLIGADLFWSLICVGRIKLGIGSPVVQRTRLGWIITGPILGNDCQNKLLCKMGKTEDVQEQLSRFWELEECREVSHLSQEEQACESHFKENVRRTASGRFEVKIPLKLPVTLLGESRDQAERRYLALEKRLLKNKDLRLQYSQFIREYRELGHMRRVDEEDIDEVIYYAPHHGVLKEDSSTTKLRVVFDCSAKTSSGYSFNDLQMTGPTIQNDLLSIILRFRLHAYVMTGDIAKMYRQILVTPEQQNLQRIIWRDEPTQLLECYNLCTVTYGTTAAPFLAVRCLHELGNKCEDQNPAVACMIKQDFYVDDVLTGGDDLEQLKDNCRFLIDHLKTGGFELRKFRSNNTELLKSVTNEESDELLKVGDHDASKTLGLAWSAKLDEFRYTVTTTNDHRNVTKRKMLSRIARIFDPLGLLGPSIILAKKMLQKLWWQHVGWDEQLPSELLKEWLEFEQELIVLNEARIPRNVKRVNSGLEIHGFCDASETAYGACIYIRSTSDDNTTTQLLCAKSKVAPLKFVTLPKLELCGAVVLVQLIRKVIQICSCEFRKCVLWCDSTIVLGWIKREPRVLKQFVANRVAKIQNLKCDHSWRHVRSEDNPADLISRGVLPSRLINQKLWWNGPPWLNNPETDWPTSIVTCEPLPELKKQVVLVTHHQPEFLQFEKFSKFQRMVRTVAYVLRFIQNCRNKKVRSEPGTLSVTEIRTAHTWVMKFAQREMFQEELCTLKNNKNVDRKSKLLKLNPFLDEEGVLRVGGRLENGPFSFDKKHPVVIDAKHHVAKLIFEYEHLKQFHAGPQALLAAIREKYWPIRGRNLAKQIANKCVRCFKVKPKSIEPIMGNLPEDRVNASYPFNTTGTDYAGPVFLKDRRGRGAKLSKAYICIFICFTTRAIHIELVSDLSTDRFLMALKRFISRRGKPQRMYSDNGTNFIGAKSYLNDLHKFVNTNFKDLEESVTNLDIEWHLIPPHSPHFGGLWEAGVKSVKYHINRVIGQAHLTFEEYNTLLVQIEAIVNSRPLAPLSTNPSDLSVLTPAHFLLHKPSTSLLDNCNPLGTTVNRLDVHGHIQMLRDHFWARWSREVISELQQRHKWHVTKGTTLRVGMLILIKEDNLPPLRWKLGRITQLHTGQDGIARVATIKTRDSVYKRAFSKICPLPIQDVEDGMLQGGGHVGK